MIREIGSQIYTNKNNSQELPFFFLGSKKRSHNFLWKTISLISSSTRQLFSFFFFFFFWWQNFAILTFVFQKLKIFIFIFIFLDFISPFYEMKIMKFTTSRPLDLLEEFALGGWGTPPWKTKLVHFLILKDLANFPN
jgi:hypothetical protein